jgi:hypothetical protein
VPSFPPLRPSANAHKLCGKAWLMLVAVDMSVEREWLWDGPGARE